MLSEQNKSIVLQMYKSFDEGNLLQVQEFLAPNFIAHVPGTATPINGEAFIQSVLMVFRSAFPDGCHTFEDVISTDDKVVTRGIFRGTHGGELQGIPPTGKQITIPFFHIDRLVDGKLVEHWGQSDVLSLMQQVGIVPIPGLALMARKLYLAIAAFTPKFNK
ncbi:putative ester cyclase [Nostoc sp. PCC 7524]|uniref:ester cyclase n=1 Tax=Nostoc sp. (strain ATCC 29411 / PCC 7524) TaxID=28072 RepID=UPI00029EDA97|nr:ester cyclase [Nostoc sp. PCC 7524]AFY49562.1 putative ester cyclase [Nostoc sp. PCC 7524]